MTRKTYCGNLLWQSSLTLFRLGSVEINKRDFDLSWNLVKVLHRGLGVFAETVTQDAEGKKFIIHFR